MRLLQNLLAYLPALLVLSILITACSTKDVKVAYFSNLKDNAAVHKNKPYVILISIDGYRHDYAKLWEPSGPAYAIENGAQASKGLEPPFPSKTFTAHWSLITGLHPDKHGIVGNTFYDPKLKKRYKYTDRRTSRDGKWYGGWPLWSWAEHHNMRTATMFWPGSAAICK